jgi:putative addiction module killer protein
MFDIIQYITPSDTKPFKDWLTQLKDKLAVAKIDARIIRLATGLFGDCKPVGQGVWELRIDHGPGYRVYYAKAGQTVILLLVGGDKKHSKRTLQQQSNIGKTTRMSHD